MSEPLISWTLTTVEQQEADRANLRAAVHKYSVVLVVAGGAAGLTLAAGILAVITYVRQRTG